MKISIIITTCSATLCLALPPNILPRDLTNYQRHRDIANYRVGLAEGFAAGFAGGVITGFYATMAGRDMKDDLLGNKYTKGFRDGYELGKAEVRNRVEEIHQELVECWVEKVGLFVSFPRSRQNSESDGYHNANTSHHTIA